MQGQMRVEIRQRLVNTLTGLPCLGAGETRPIISEARKSPTDFSRTALV